MLTGKKQYVEFMLEINHLRVDFNNLVTWASGIKSPIYVDNRGSLSDFDIRNMIYHHIAKDLESKQIEIDAIVAAPTAGVHIGASVAQILGVPFVMIIDGQAKEVKPNPIIWSGSKYDLLVGTNPEAIPWGIWFANELKLPFAYVRPPKKHGLKNSVEGLVKSNEKRTAMFLNYFLGIDLDENELRTTAVSTMAELGVNPGETKEEWCRKYVDDIDLSNKAVVVIEDLFSTSGSAIKNVKEVRDCGGFVEDIYAIFDYELKESDQTIKDAIVSKSSFITAKEFLDIAQEMDPLIKANRSKIDLFLADPWGFTKKFKEN